MDPEESAAYEPKRGPFDFDMKSVWKRDADDKEDKEKREENEVHVEGTPGSAKEEIKVPEITPRYPHRTQPTEEFHGENRHYFSQEPDHEKNEPVNFSKLMSGGYGDEWLQQRDEWDKKNPNPNDAETSHSESTQTDDE